MRERFDRYWFSPESAFRLGATRLSFFSFLAIYYTMNTGRMWDWASLPKAHWAPVGSMRFFSEPPLGPEALEGVHWLFVALLALSAVGLLTRLSTLGALLTGNLLVETRLSYGEVVHDDMAVVLFLFIFALCPCGDEVSLDWYRQKRSLEPNWRYAWPIRAMWVVSTSIYFGAAISKLSSQGFGWVTSDSVRKILEFSHHAPSISPTGSALGLGLALSAYPLLCKFIAAAVLCLEISAPLALVYPKIRPFLAGSLALMHLSFHFMITDEFFNGLAFFLCWIPFAKSRTFATSLLKTVVATTVCLSSVYFFATRHSTAPTEVQTELLAAHVDAVVRGRTREAFPVADPVYVAFREKGEFLKAAWSNSDLTAALLEARVDSADTVEVCFSSQYRPAKYDAKLEFSRGILGIENGSQRFSPTWMLSKNMSFRSLISKDSRLFEARQFLVLLGEEPQATEMYRGNVLENEVSQESTEKLFSELKDWYLRQKGLPYLYEPSSGRSDSSQELMVRRSLALWSLSCLGKPVSLESYLQTDLDLGSLAFLGLAALESSDPAMDLIRDRLSLRFEKNGRIKGAWQNYYPGQALLFWTSLYQRHPDEELLAKLMKSFRFYRDWHRADRHPDFVPWHTQAYHNLWLITKDPQLRDFIFEMNDWVLFMQQTDSQFADFEGQFWDPSHPEYRELPHVKVTAVYLGGLIRAFELATEIGDTSRQTRYRKAILKGLRSLQQHQFQDTIDMFYVSNPERVRGGLRSTVYDNRIRIDGAAHALQALLRLRESFQESDYLE